MSQAEQAPPQQFLGPEFVMAELADDGGRSVMGRTVPQILLLAVLGGGFITAGALFSVIISTGTDNQGVETLLEGFGFSVGFFMVMLSGTLLFTEANIEMPATLLGRIPSVPARRVFRLWALAGVGNLLGAVLVGLAVSKAQNYSPAVTEHLGEIVERKLRYREIGGLDGWSRAVLSGVLGNWLVGMAAFLSTMGRSIIGKYVPVFLVVSAFVAGGFLHSPANMAFIGLAEPIGVGQGWSQSLIWGIAPAAVGNVLGGLFLVAFPFWFLSRNQTVADEPSSEDEPSSAEDR